MGYLALVFALIAVAGAGPLDQSARIIDGQHAVPGQFPWHVLVNHKGGFCGGSLISPKWVLTAAHCLPGTVWGLHLGSVDQADRNEEGRIELESTSAFPHPDFVPYVHDIGLIELAEPVETNWRISTIRLYNESEPLGGDVNVTVSGWGLQRDGTFSDILNYVNLTTQTNEQCVDFYGNQTIVDSIICTVGNPYHGVCGGDSGGPLVIYDEDGVPAQVGIVSFGHGCNDGNPNGYARPDFYLD